MRLLGSLSLSLSLRLSLSCFRLYACVHVFIYMYKRFISSPRLCNKQVYASVSPSESHICEKVNSSNLFTASILKCDFMHLLSCCFIVYIYINRTSAPVVHVPIMDRCLIRRLCNRDLSMMNHRVYAVSSPYAFLNARYHHVPSTPMHPFHIVNSLSSSPTLMISYSSHHHSIQVILPILVLLLYLLLHLSTLPVVLFLRFVLLFNGRILIPIHMFDGYKVEAHNEEQDVCFPIAEDVSERVSCPVSLEERGMISWNKERKGVRAL